MASLADVFRVLNTLEEDGIIERYAWAAPWP
jgi:Fe2+ or Zn2+ uptake regulation protein